VAELPALAARSSPGKRPDFASGVASLPRALIELLKSPDLWPAAVVPTLVYLALASGFGSLALFVARPWLIARMSEGSSNTGALAWIGIAWVVALLLVVVGFYAALALSPVLSAPALERIVERIERRLGVPPRTPLGFFRELACGLRAMAGALAVALPISVCLWVGGMFVPGAVVVTVPAGMLLNSLLVAWGLFDYPLTLRGIGFRARLDLLVRNFGAVLGFGAAFAVFFWLPCVGVTLLPVGAIAATRLVCGILGLGQPEKPGPSG
jgi:uncharacterized protein involved in cysteine biosynthesis